ncbi:MAG TPA: SCP2 sterol-binding domain-containing protein [Pseudomonadales bacterium]|nr:SCP2 sterol-binding domain-containing protein [Pseudomonadales bacterium]
MPSLVDSFIAGAAETALAAALRADPTTRAELAALAPRRLRISSERPPLSLTLVFVDTGLCVEADREAPADATVTTTPAGIVDLLAGDRGRAVLSGNVRVEGDGDFAAMALSLLARLSPDLEGPLARILGETPSAALGAAARRGGQLAREAAGASATLTRAWLTGPDGPLPGRVEVARFLDEVDDLRLATDRLGARVAALAAARAAAANDDGAEAADAAPTPGDGA